MCITVQKQYLGFLRDAGRAAVTNFGPRATNQGYVYILYSIFQNSYQKTLTEHLGLGNQFRFINNLLELHRFETTKISKKMLESVAVLRVATCFLTKWYYFYRIKSEFLHSQSGFNPSKETTVSPMMNKFKQPLRQYKKIYSDSMPYSTNILSFFLKCLYFHTGYGDLVSCFERDRWLISNVKGFHSLKKVNILV